MSEVKKTSSSVFAPWLEFGCNMDIVLITFIMIGTTKTLAFYILLVVPCWYILEEAMASTSFAVAAELSLCVRSVEGISSIEFKDNNQCEFALCERGHIEHSDGCLQHPISQFDCVASEAFSSA